MEKIKKSIDFILSDRPKWAKVVGIVGALLAAFGGALASTNPATAPAALFVLLKFGGWFTFGGSFLTIFSQLFNRNKAMSKTEEINALGIELILKLIDVTMDTANEVKDDLKDGKLSTKEMIGLIDNAVALGRAGLNWKKLIEQIYDVTSDEGAIILQHIVDKGYLPMKATEILQHAIEFAKIEIQAYNEHIKPVINILHN